LKLKNLSSSPISCLTLLLIPFFFYFSDLHYWWIWILIIQSVLAIVGLLVKSWRLLSFLALILLLMFNLPWFTSLDPVPVTCNDRVDMLTARVKNDSHEKSPNLELIKVKLWCRGSSITRPMARIALPSSFYNRPVNFRPGDKLEVKYLTLLNEGIFELELKPTTGFGIFNLSFQTRVLSRGPLLLYLQAKSRYYLDGFSLGVTKALMTADRSGIESQWYELFKELGVIHVFAISGMHIGIIYLWLSFFFRRLISIPCRLIEQGYGIVLADLISLGLIVLFLIMIGLPISAKRAVFMLAWWILIKHLFSWQPLWFVLLGVALGTLLQNPLTIGQVSFQLSFLSVLGILTVLPLLPVGSLEDTYFVKLAKRFLSTFLVSCWLMVFTFPIVLMLTGYQSLMSPLNNFFHIMFVSTVFLPVLIFVLVIGLFGYLTGVSPGEFYFYSLVHFLAKFWEKMLVWNQSVNSTFLIRTSIEWGVVSLLLFWGLMILLPLSLDRYRKRKY
jgi:ComEC/Rec2-related protein